MSEGLGRAAFGCAEADDRAPCLGPATEHQAWRICAPPAGGRGHCCGLGRGAQEARQAGRALALPRQPQPERLHWVPGACRHRVSGGTHPHAIEFQTCRPERAPSLCARPLQTGFRGAFDALQANKQVVSRGLTFELTGPRRQDALARLAKMYPVPPTGPRWPAVAGPVERGVRPR